VVPKTILLFVPIDGVIHPATVDHLYGWPDYSYDYESCYVRQAAGAGGGPNGAPPLRLPHPLHSKIPQSVVSHGNAFGLGGFDGALRPHGPWGPAGGHFRLSKIRSPRPLRRFGGFVAKYLGDGVLIYFGYPQAHEGDAERAVRAGLELVEAVAVLKAPVSLQTRVGVATGLVVVGEGSGIRGWKCH
jgi:Adenylate and Guanylate cyclase catalytic domain